MANQDITVKFNQPRGLRPEGETVQSLNQWIAHTEVYYARERNFECFFEETARWDMSHAGGNYGQVAEDEGRTAPTKAKHLKYLLTLIASFSPWEHLQNKLLTQTTRIKDVWDAIYLAFGCASTNERFLDFVKISKSPMESYLTFYERLASHIRQHLAPAGTRAGNATAPPGGDTLTVSLQDLLTTIWLQRIDPRLPDIVQTEFYNRLQGGTRLAELVPTIASQVDQLLTRYDGAGPGDNVNTIRTKVTQSMAPVEVESLIDATVNKLNFGGRPRSNDGGRQGGSRFGGGRDRGFTSRSSGGGREGGFQGRGRGGGFQGRGQDNGSGGFRQRSDRRETCPYCTFLAAAFKLKIPTDHGPQQCSHRAGAVNLIQAAQEDKEEPEEIDLLEDAIRAISELEAPQDDLPGGSSTDKVLKKLYSWEFLQTVVGTDVIRSIQEKLSRGSEVNNDNVSFIASRNRNQFSTRSSHFNCLLENLLDTRARVGAILLPGQKESGPRKARSPTLLGRTNGQDFVLIIDEGAELNVMDEGLANSLGLEVDDSLARAAAANNTALQITGQTTADLLINVDTDGGSVELNLGKVPIVRNLGCSLLLGEASKADNRIMTIPHQKEVVISREGKEYVSPYYEIAKGVARKNTKIKSVQKQDKQEKEKT